MNDPLLRLIQREALETETCYLGQQLDGAEPCGKCAICIFMAACPPDLKWGKHPGLTHDDEFVRRSTITPEDPA